MKLRQFLSLCLTALVLSAAAQAEPQPDANAQLLQDLLKVNEAFVVAVKNHDLATMKAMTSHDFIAVDPYFPYMLVGDDVLTDEMTAWDNYYKRANGDEVLLRSPSQPRVRRFGDIAILTYVELDVVKTLGERVRGGRAGKCTFVYHQENGKWILINSEITDQVWPGSVLLGNGQ